MRVLFLRASLVISLLIAIVLIGALPTHSDTQRSKQRLTNEDRATKRGGRHATLPLSYRSFGAQHKLLIPAEDAALEQQMDAAHLTRRTRKLGAYSLVEVSDETLANLSARVLERAQVRDDLNLVMLKRGQIDTTGPAPQIESDLRQTASSSRALHLVQLFGPPTPAALRAITATGAKIVSYVPNNTYLVWAAPSQLARVQALKGDNGLVQWVGPFHPAYKLDPRIKLESVEQIPASIQILDTPEAANTIAAVKSAARGVLMTESKIGGIIHLKVLAESFTLKQLARLNDVVAIEPWARMRMMDERANQIVAGQITKETQNNIQISRPSAPGYLGFLSTLGFNSDFDFAIDIGDTGFDSGSADTSRMHPDFTNAAGVSRVAYLTDWTGDAHPPALNLLPTHDTAGHGTFNAGAAMGFNNKTGGAFVDATGFSYGLGVAPFARIGVSKLFNDDGDFVVSSFAVYISEAYRRGARISSNSWGSPCDSGCNFYSDDSTIFDSLVRDADPFNVDDQGLTIIFAAGNDGEPNAPSIAIPGTAKNVIAVGASESFRTTDSAGNAIRDLCGDGPTDADNSLDVTAFSGFGATQDGRAKPDIVAPGTLIISTASQDTQFNGAGICAVSGSDYFPIGQRLYTISSGTSHATPLVAGGAALSFKWLRDQLSHEPSPAMVKAFLLNSTSYLTGKLGSDNLPGAHQGWGLMDLGRMFEPTSRILYDQSPLRTFTESGGAAFERTGVIADSSKEFRVMLAYTDAPGNAATNAPYVNQLNLEVVVGGVVYQGNNFNGQYSKVGGQQDFLNNTQGVRLPAGTTGPFVIRVRPTLIAGDGVPSLNGALDQDFALVATNAIETAVPVLTIDAVNDLSAGVSVRHSNGVTDSAVLPGETVQLTIAVANKSQSAAATINAASLSLLVDGNAVGQASASAYEAIQAGQSGNNATPFSLQIPSTLRCGSVATLSLQVTTAIGSFKLPVRVQVGRASTTAQVLLLDDVDNGNVKWKKKSGFDVSTVIARSGSQSFRAIDKGREEADDQLSKLQMKKAFSIPANAGRVRLSFYHIFNFEPGYDGGVLEISSDGGETWDDLGSRMMVGGYDGKVTDTSDNPLGSRLAWTARGKPGVFSQVVINLDDYAGKKIRLQFLAGFDASTGIADGYTGWFIDDITITAGLFQCGAAASEAPAEAPGLLRELRQRPTGGRPGARIE
jgi:hypothetical protein